MNQPAVGLQVTVNGVPVELLHMVRESNTGQVWWVRPLFVTEPERELTIRPTDTCRSLHTQFAR